VLLPASKITVDLKVSNGPGLALGPQKSMVFGLIVAEKMLLDGKAKESGETWMLKQVMVLGSSGYDTT
jgi:hypothetical protein